MMMIILIKYDVIPFLNNEVLNKQATILDLQTQAARNINLCITPYQASEKS
jgi:hypothetical protein